MAFFELFLIAIGLSMDAFAVSLCKGLQMKTFNIKQTFVIALFFGGFQALMPFLGWLLGFQFKEYITNFDHWIAFVLLVFIGGKMLYDCFSKSDDKDENCDCANQNKEQTKSFSISELFILAIATSIDALAVGITFAFLKVNILTSCVTIGITTFVFSIFGVFLGHKVGNKFQKIAEICGGIILIAIGTKILIEHLFF